MEVVRVELVVYGTLRKVRYEVHLLCEAPRCRTLNRPVVESRTPSRFPVRNSLLSCTSEGVRRLVAYNCGGSWASDAPQPQQHRLLHSPRMPYAQPLAMRQVARSPRLMVFTADSNPSIITRCGCASAGRCACVVAHRAEEGEGGLSFHCRSS